jgi:two-component system response regulator FixJ
MRDDVIVHIVDDDEAVRRSMVFLCSSAGYAVRPHVSATAFLAVAPSLKKDCLLVDLRMPDMNGVELLRRLREIDAALPTVVVTGNGDIKMAVEAMKLGAIDFVEKPFVDAVLFNAIERAANQATFEFNSAQTRNLIKSRLDSLSEREQQVLDGILVGLPTKSIALELELSPRTVEVYRASLMAKMQAGSLSELVRMTLAAGYEFRNGDTAA